MIGLHSFSDSSLDAAHRTLGRGSAVTCRLCQLIYHHLPYLSKKTVRVLSILAVPIDMDSLAGNLIRGMGRNRTSAICLHRLTVLHVYSTFLRTPGLRSCTRDRSPGRKIPRKSWAFSVIHGSWFK